MKILAIRIKNLASLEGETEIDFTKEPLRSAGIFAITGPTGAGKSTILDALSLALYAKTPRYLQAKEGGIDVQDVGENKISQSDIRGILRDGTAEGFAEVDFVGIDGQHYKATWNVRRARNRADGSLQNYTISLKNISTNADIPGKKTELLPEIERLVGLNFEQFTRSALLAQGDFTAFLKAPKDEKSSLLEKLTGTQIYSEISIRIFEKHRNVQQELRDLNLQREGILTLNQEEKDAYLQQKAFIEKNIEEQARQVELFTKEIHWHSQFILLQSHLATAIEKHNQVVESKSNAASREQYLKQIERVQPARSLVDAKINLSKQLAEKSIALKEIEETLSGLQKQKIEQDELFRIANDDLLAKTKANEDAKPLFDAAKILDVQITERTGRVKVAREDRDIALANKNLQDEQMRAKEEEASLLLASIEVLRKWKEENSLRQPLADNHSLIASKLDDAQKQLNALQELMTKIERATSNIDQQKKEKDKLTEASIAIAAELKSTQQIYDKRSAALSALDLLALEKKKRAIDEVLEDSIRAESHWKILWKMLSDYHALRQKLLANKEDLLKQEDLWKKSEDHFTKVEIQRDASLQILEKARLAAAENVGALRQQLISGDPCPVCGSEEHPYAEHNPQLDHVLSELNADHKMLELRYKESLKNRSSLEEKYTQLQKTITDQEIEIVSTESGLKKYQAEWKKFPIYKACKDIPDEQKASWMEEQLIANRAIQKGLQEKIQACQNEKQQLDSEQQQLTKLNAQQNENSNKIKDTDRLLQSIGEQLQQYNTTRENLNAGLSETEKLLNPYFVVTDWFIQWKNDPKKFVELINAFAAKWKADMQKLEQDSVKFDLLSEAKRAMQEQSKSIRIELEKKEEILSGLNKQLFEFSKERKLIFAGESVERIEMDLNQAVEKALQGLDKLKGDRDALQANIIRTTAQIEQTGKDISTLEIQKRESTDKLQQWLLADHKKNDSSIDESGLLALLAISSEWIETESASLRVLDDAITEAQSVLNERRDALDRHDKQRLSERQADELNVLLTEAKELWNKSIEEKNKIQFQLDQDQANKHKIGDLLQSIEAKTLVVRNWAILNEMIGSADGKKFRQTAQEYTLDILLGYANVHLQMLSKRYLLQRIPETLGLQVLDQDMGNEIRTVFSLSGGESFLVSLALALGLASLSSSRMQVESLFIDEGFGSLDPATLNIAVDALERLHNQGRKVGVISHVQEMTERIPVQIRVNKENSGRSKVEII